MLTLLSVPQLRRMGRIDKNGQVIETNGGQPPPGAHPDEGFRHGRPDLFLGVPA